MTSANSTSNQDRDCACKCSGRLSMVVYALWLAFLVSMVVERFVDY